MLVATTEGGNSLRDPSLVRRCVLGFGDTATSVSAVSLTQVAEDDPALLPFLLVGAAPGASTDTTRIAMREES